MCPCNQWLSLWFLPGKSHRQRSLAGYSPEIKHDLVPKQQQKCTINAMHLNHPKPCLLPLVHGKIVFYEISSWCQKDWGPLA